MFQGPPGVAVPTLLPRLPVASVHRPAFGLSNRSPLMPSTLRGKPDAKLLTGNHRTSKPQFPEAELPKLRYGLLLPSGDVEQELSCS